MPHSAKRTFSEPFPTTRISVPNFATLVWRLRDDRIKRSVTIVHARHQGEGEWVLGIAAARIMRRGVRVVGPEPSTVFDLVEYGLRRDAKVVFCGELRRAEDGRALRGAAANGIRAVGIVTTENLEEARTMVKALGPWPDYDVALISVTDHRGSPQARPAFG